MKQITHVLFSLTIGGTENMLVDIVNEQVKTNSVRIIIINNEYDMRVLNLISNNVDIIKLNREKGLLGCLSILKLIKLCYFQKNEIIHIHNKKLLFLFPKFLFRNFSLVFTMHDTNESLGNERLNPDYFCAISNAVKDDLTTRYPDLDPLIIHNGIKFNKVTCKEIFKPSFKILQISRLAHEKKGQDILIKAIKILSEKGLEVQLDFIGDGPSKYYLIDLISTLELESQVNLLGALSKSDIYQIIKNYDALAQPSRYEGFGLTVIEGIAAKVPVIVSDIEGPMEVISNGDYGIPFKCGSEDACAAAIENLYKNYEEYNVEGAYNYAKANFDIKTTATKYASLTKK